MRTAIAILVLTAAILSGGPAAAQGNPSVAVIAAEAATTTAFDQQAALEDEVRASRSASNVTCNLDAWALAPAVEQGWSATAQASCVSFDILSGYGITIELALQEYVWWMDGWQTVDTVTCYQASTLAAASQAACVAPNALQSSHGANGIADFVRLRARVQVNGDLKQTRYFGPLICPDPTDDALAC